MASDNPNPAETLALADIWRQTAELYNGFAPSDLASRDELRALCRGVRAMAEELAQVRADYRNYRVMAEAAEAERDALKADCERRRAELAQVKAVIDEAKRLRALGPQAVDENFDWVEEANRRGNVVICLLAELAEANSYSKRLRKELTASEADVASLQRVIAGAIEADRAAQGGQGK